MTISIFRDEIIEKYDFTPFAIQSGTGSAVVSAAAVPLVRSKLETPSISGLVERDWLLGLLERSAKNAAATILIGRAGTGKTALAAHLAMRFSGHSWYSIDSTDADWTTFQRYFREALNPKKSHPKRGHSKCLEAVFSATPMELFADLAAAMELCEQKWPALLVLDGVHHLYDCSWFDEFFHYLISSLPHYAHVVLISRSKPTAPIWRMRSKQVLNVFDEKLLTFSLAETNALFDQLGLTNTAATRVHRETFGRPGEIMSFVRSEQCA